ncbi:ABC transporter ATP-binding protein [Ponticaulis profundi]|uniref:ABC transporter ATP-binding protein n=1 Tax=Ponticaulis profundi TaxID=2665222 RepID=A0ABW1S4U6_9PROT
MTETNTPLIDIRDLHFNWPNEPDLIDIPAFQMNRRDRVFLEGESGSGKSTLLGLIAGVLQPSSGTIRFSGSELNKLSSGKRDRLRADRMGVIFQLFNLLPYLSVIENVVLPCRFSKRRKENALQRSNTIDAEARRLLQRLGLSDERLIHRKVSDLSVGQQQRVAAARALIGSPDLIIADEPTSALDTSNRDQFLALLMEEADAAEAGLLFVSHDPSLGARFDRRIALSTLNEAFSKQHEPTS